MRGRDLHCEGHLPHHHALLDKRGSYAPNGRPAGTGFEDRRGTDTPLITPKLTKDTQHELAVIQALHELAVIQAQFELTVIQTQHDLTIIQAQHELSVIQAKHKLAVIQAQHKLAVIQAQHKLPVIQAHHHGPLDERGSDAPHGRPASTGFEDGRGTDTPLIAPKLTKDTQHELAVIQALHELAVIQAQHKLMVIITRKV